ncbi:hypothetical protein BTO04_08780 [Polaribacter sp. SA4-10]|nr:hypothetical protein BTO04_08780 [Polaribacter sp. SA4-10]
MEAFDERVRFLSPLMIDDVIGGSIVLLFNITIIHKDDGLYKYLNTKHPVKRRIIVLIGALRVVIYLAILNAVYHSALKENTNHI